MQAERGVIAVGSGGGAAREKKSVKSQHAGTGL